MENVTPLSKQLSRTCAVLTLSVPSLSFNLRARQLYEDHYTLLLVKEIITVFSTSEKATLKDLLAYWRAFLWKKKKISNSLKTDSPKSLLKFALMSFPKTINFADFMDYVCVSKQIREYNPTLSFLMTTKDRQHQMELLTSLEEIGVFPIWQLCNLLG